MTVLHEGDVLSEGSLVPVLQDQRVILPGEIGNVSY